MEYLGPEIICKKVLFFFMNFVTGHNNPMNKMSHSNAKHSYKSLMHAIHSESSKKKMKIDCKISIVKQFNTLEWKKQKWKKSGIIFNEMDIFPLVIISPQGVVCSIPIIDTSIFKCCSLAGMDIIYNFILSFSVLYESKNQR